MCVVCVCGVQLLNPLAALPGSALFRALTWATCLEDASHILMWSRSEAAVGEQCALSLVELPRLGLSFAPRSEPDGSTRMWLLEHPNLCVLLCWCRCWSAALCRALHWHSGVVLAL